MKSSAKPRKKKFINSSSLLVIKAACKKGVKVETILPSLFYYQLSRGKKKYLFCEGMCDLMNAPASFAANRKDLSYQIMMKWGIPVPGSIITEDYKKCQDFLKKYKKVVVKPKGLRWGLGVTAGITNERMLKRAVDNLKRYISDEESFITQEFLEGRDHRLLVIGYKEVFCLQRNPAGVIGDGKTTIRELIRTRKIKIGSITKFLKTPPGVMSLALQAQGFRLDSVVPKGKFVKLTTAANAHFGGFTVDKTNEVCKEAIKIAIKIARRFAAPVLGVDCISEDISKTVGKITEVNPTPDLFMHTEPNVGEGHNPAEPLIDFLFFADNEKDLKLRAELTK